MNLARLAHGGLSQDRRYGSAAYGFGHDERFPALIGMANCQPVHMALDHTDHARLRLPRPGVSRDHPNHEKGKLFSSTDDPAARLRAGFSRELGQRNVPWALEMLDEYAGHVLPVAPSNALSPGEELTSSALSVPRSVCSRSNSRPRAKPSTWPHRGATSRSAASASRARVPPDAGSTELALGRFLPLHAADHACCRIAETPRVGTGSLNERIPAPRKFFASSPTRNGNRPGSRRPCAFRPGRRPCPVVEESSFTTQARPPAKRDQVFRVLRCGANLVSILYSRVACRSWRGPITGAAAACH